jgi:5-methyltetrahydrofolate--homocysteine methyltransferase
VRQLCDEFTAPTRPSRASAPACSARPRRTLSISPDVNDPGYRNVSFDALADDYYDSARA